MFGRIVFAAAFAGLVAGVVLTSIQAYTVIPLILEAETYEGLESASDAHGHESEEALDGDSQGEDDHHGDGWAPAEGRERLTYTLLTNIIAGVAFSLMLIGAMAFAGTSDWRRGLIWGLAGYATFNLAPALGLPPELPGMAAGDLVARQIWWTATAAATALGLALLLLVPRIVFRVLGAALIIAPHIIGAPHPHDAAPSAVPAELAAAFVSATLVSNLVFWLVIGGLSAWTFKRLSRHAVDQVDERPGD
jgi:cobalt transporter subunit CbtA